ncbi:MAG: TetR/AcrR family transcriptional regulator [Rubrobacter sp.]|jgi:AcrR family transcriptional regulator|nr:TetR/AcrR family transcriptional regulator [Rubrobacter sp.]
MDGTEKRTMTPAGERVLRAASEMFYREGIRAVGVEAIAAEAGVTKKTLYERFGSKDGLIVAYLRARDERWRSWMEESVEGSGGSPKERLLSTFDALEGWIERENPRGCGFVNAAAENPDPSHPARKLAIEQKKWLREYFEKLSEEAGAEEPGDLAERLVILHEGATVAHSLEAATDTARKAKQIAAILIADLPE